MGKPTICKGEIKGTDQRFVFAIRIVFLFYLNPNFKLQALFCALVQVGLCRTCSKTTLLVFPRGTSRQDQEKIPTPKTEVGKNQTNNQILIQ